MINLFKKFDKKVLVIGVLITIIVFLSMSSVKNNRKYLREKNNVEALLTEMQSEKTKTGEYLTTIQELQLTVKEFKKLHKEDTELIKSLKVRPSEVKEIVKTVIETKVETRDSIIEVNPGIFKYENKNKWWKINQIIDFTVTPAISDIELTVRDSLTHILYKVPKFKFLGLHFGTKRYEIKCINHNPNSEIIYNSWINISKDKTKRNRN